MKIHRTYLIILPLVFFISCKGHVYRTPTASMENTLMRDKSFYVTPANDFRKNDIVVFNYVGLDYVTKDKKTGQFIPNEHKRIYRLIAWSGDTLYIKDGEVFINGRHIPMPPKAKTDYEVFSKVHIDEFEQNQDPYSSDIKQNGDTLVYTESLTGEQVFDYEQRKPAILAVKRKVYPVNMNDTDYARASAAGTWSADYYGPLRIPSPGDAIFVDSINFKLYHNIPGILPGKNIIKEKLYFVLGDNRHAAEDSRYIGLVSQSKMYGIVK
ncbi:MAG: S26 family signal peptidase [Bacteroidota bacterium]|nr:S26 family signal peptidase [Bacteroidota bacterium]